MKILRTGEYCVYFAPNRSYPKKINLGVIYKVLRKKILKKKEKEINE